MSYDAGLVAVIPGVARDVFEMCLESVQLCCHASSATELMQVAGLCTCLLLQAVGTELGLLQSKAQA